MTDTLRTFEAGNGKTGLYYSLPALEEKGLGKISRLPVSIRIVLESVLRNCDGKKVTERDVATLAAWNAKSPAQEEIPFVVARIVLQDFTGVPLLVDLAAMRSAVANLKKDPKIIEPLVPVDLVVDHSVQVDFFGSADALRLNLEMEFKRNRERYRFLKWGQQAFEDFRRGPAWHWHRSPGQPGISCQGRPQREHTSGHRLLSGHSCRHRLAHDHDQWTRCRRLGSWRHRGRGGHARPAGVFSHTGGRGRPPHRHPQGGRHRDRSRSPRHGNAPQTEGRRKIR